MCSQKESPLKETPMLKQYLAIKAKYKDAILFYRMGDFYEMFFSDAETASRILEITLTSRNKNDESPIPMCGVPYRAAQNYLVRLINKGYKVAICDQIEDPSTATGIVKRDVVRVITPGMILDTEFLDAKSNNYILAITINQNFIGLSYVDISTGVFRITESSDKNIILEEALRISPSEIIFPDFFKNDQNVNLFVKAFMEKSVTFLENKFFEFKNCRENLIEHFKTLSLEGFGCDHLKSGICAAGALLFYIKENQKDPLTHLSKIETYSSDQYLLLDESTIKNLELFKNLKTGTKTGTLIHAIDKTITSMGSRLLTNWIRYPLLDTEKIKDRLDAVEDVINQNSVRRQIIDCLKSINDLERIISKIVMGHSNARDLLALKQSLFKLPEIESALILLNANLFKWTVDIESLISIAKLIDSAIREDSPMAVNEGNIIKDGYSEQLDELIKISREGKNWLASLEAKEKEKTGINSLKVRYNKIFGYYIEIPKGRINSVPNYYVRRQTLANAERFITDELRSFEQKVMGAEEMRVALESKILNEIREKVANDHIKIRDAAQFLAQIDVIISLAEIASENNYNRPKINNEGQILIDDGRHPVIEKLITGERFVPNSINLDNSHNQVLIITGPNMAGKSTVLRQVALTVLMAQMGSFIPAKNCSISLTDRIFTRIGALDNLSCGQSTFMVEMQETANILNNATSNSLIIMDEIGRGTSTFDGLSIAWSVVEYLHDLNATGVKTLFATHYHELTSLSKIKHRVKNFNIAVKEIDNKIIFLRKLLEGSTNKSYGIQVAQLAGIPDKVIERAKKILNKIETGEQNLILNSKTNEPKKKENKNGHVQLDLFNSQNNYAISWN